MKKVISLFLSILMLFSTMTGLTFTAQAKVQITKIEVNSVPEPSIGATIKDLCFFSVPDGAEYCGFSSDFTKCMLWFDLSSDTPDIALPMDTVCVEGHKYMVSVRLMAVGNTFASSPEAYLNGGKTLTSTYLGRNKSTNLAVEYHFPKLTKKPIDNINAFFKFGKFTKGVTVNSDSTFVSSNSVSAVTTGWFHNGTAVQGETTVTYGNWGFLIGMTASDTTYFTETSTITIEGRKLTPTNIYSNGKVAFFRSADNFFSVSCTHNYSSSWSYDGTTHWKQCSVCGDKGELNAHTFGVGVTEGDITTYTCSVCNVCGNSETKTIPATGHTLKTTVTKATTSKNGSKVTKCTVCGTQTAKSTIYYPKTITLSATKYTYDGKVKKPTVKVVDANGKTIASSNYTVTYASGRKNVGKYTVKIAFKGNYSGTVSKTFVINPKNTSISSLSAISKGFTVKWKKQATQTTGYQIQIATDSKFTKNKKSYTVAKNSTVSKKITKLTGKKKYYVRIRTYKTVSGTKYYSSWSKAKTVTTKK